MPLHGRRASSRITPTHRAWHLAFRENLQRDCNSALLKSSTHRIAKASRSGFTIWENLCKWYKDPDRIQTQYLTLNDGLSSTFFRNRKADFEDDAVGICAGLWNFALSYLRNNSNKFYGLTVIVLVFIALVFIPFVLLK